MKNRHQLSTMYRRFICKKLKEKGIFKIEGKYILWYKNKFLFDFYLKTFGSSHEEDFETKEQMDYQRKLKYKESIKDSEFIYVFGNFKKEICKIGYSTNPLKRLNSIQTGCPFKLEIILILRGDRKIEKNLHKKYKKYKTNGEWFSFSGELRNSINSMINHKSNLVGDFTI